MRIERATLASPHRRRASAILLLALAAFAAPAPAQQKAPVEKAQGLEDWEHDFDISKLSPGTYNVVVTGKDVAGNVALGGPINIQVDPKSDLPVVSIINPVPLQRVGGDLNIVGTCVDDDGVARVEASLDGGEWLAAQGTEFWSLYLGTKVIPEGRRNLSVRGVDIHGLAGNPVKVSFNLDRSVPVASVSSPEQGALVAGKVKIQGAAFDANGLASLEFSQDGGRSFSRLSLKRGKEAEKALFSVELDTRKFPDGPRVIWLRSVDGVGSKGTSAFLLFVDNTKPTIEVSRPASGAMVNGRFTIAGAVRDAIGIAELSYEFVGVEKGSIALTPGNPFFSKELDARLAKGGKAEVVLIARDRIGNVTKLAIAPKIDAEGDKPIVHVLFPSIEGKIRPGEVLWGSIQDDDGGAGIKVAVDGGQATEHPASGVFSWSLPDLASGKHVISLQARDVEGTWGKALSFPVIVDRGPGSVRFQRLTVPKPPQGGANAAASALVPADYAPGLEFRVDSGAFLEGSVSSPNPPKEAVFIVAGGSERKLELGKGSEAATWAFRIALDRSMPYGFTPIEVRISDLYGNTCGSKALLYSTDLSREREDTGFVFDDPRIGEGGRIVLGQGDPLMGAFYREDIAAVALEPGTSLVTASFEGKVLRIEAARAGVSMPTRIVVKTRRGHEYHSGAFVFVSDTQAPSIEITSPLEGAWANAGLLVKGRVVDEGGVAALSLVLKAGAPPRPVSLASDGSFSLAVAPSDLSEGSGLLELDALDVAGNSTRAFRSFGFDATPPVLTFLSPDPGAEVSGPEDIAATVSDLSGIATLDFAIDGQAFTAIDRRGLAFIHRADLAANPSAAYRVSDKAGNVTIARPAVKPVAKPLRVQASDSVSVEPEGAEPRVDLAGSAGTGRKLALVLPALKDTDFIALGFAALSAETAPQAGTSEAAPAPASPPAAADFVSREAPSRFALRLLISGTASLKGSVKTDALVKAVGFSLDGGATYSSLFLAKDPKAFVATAPIAISVDSTKMKDGEARWILRIEDATGSLSFAPIYALIDNAKPELAVISPAANASDKATPAMAGPVPVVFRAWDPRGIVQASISAGLDKRSLPVEDGGAFYAAWADPFAPTAAKGDLVLALDAKDGAGNSASATAKYAYNMPADLPKIDLALEQAKAGAFALGSDLVRGGASDDDGTPLVRLSVDGAAVGDYPAASFGIALAALGPGKHSILVEAKDELGRLASAKRDLVVAGSAPRFSGLAAGTEKSAQPWLPGMELEPAQGLGLQGLVDAPNGLASLEYKVNGGAALKASLGKAAAGSGTFFACALPSVLPLERFAVEIIARDLAGLESRRNCDFHGILKPAAGSPPSDSADAVTFFDARISGAEGSATLDLPPGESLEGLWNGRPLKSLAIVPATPLLSASFKGSALKMESKAEGLVAAGSLTLRAETVDGDLFEWGPFGLVSDASPPSLSVDLPADDAWVQGSVMVSGTAADSGKLASVTVSVNGGSPSAIKADKVFAGEVSLAAAQDGAVRLDIIAKDGAGREARQLRFINKDSLPPDLSQVLPVEAESVNGTLTFLGEAKDAGQLASVVFHADPKSPPEAVAGGAIFAHTLDLARLPQPLPEGAGFVVTDKAGNSALLRPVLTVDNEKDKPVVAIYAPAELEVLRSDFTISGSVYDDDGVARLLYRIDGGPWDSMVPKDASFSIPVRLADTTDNEHLVEAKAEDIYGIQGDIASSHYRISKEEPTALMSAPGLDKPVRGLVAIAGTTADANGIASISLSFDNGVSYSHAADEESWRYPLDTRILKDGLHPITIRPLDNYGTEGFYASLVTIDNTPPAVELSLPRDGSVFSGTLEVSGRVMDAVRLASARVEILPIGQAKPPVLTVDLGPFAIIRKSIDISSLAPGDYTIKLIGRDRADNEAFVSRDIEIRGDRRSDKVDLLFPVDGQEISGKLRLYGQASVIRGGSSATILLDGEDIGPAPLNPQGFFVFDVPPERLKEGPHAFSALVKAEDGKVIISRQAAILWNPNGPWITIDSATAGSFLRERPWLSGKAGFVAAGPEPNDTAGLASFKKSAPSRRVVKVEYSLDNGRSFAAASGTDAWRFRLETQDYAEGEVHVILRALFGDGSSATAKTILALDKTAPTIRIMTPVENGRFNTSFHISGTATDSSGLDSVGLSLRKGDKRGYELPAFIQGLYLDGHYFGATTWDLGVGLTFFSDNVKLQAAFGQAPAISAGEQSRFYGDVYSAKLIANVLFLPFSSFLGPDWAFLSTSLGVGAQFSYFTQDGGTGIGLSAVVAQLEFPKFTFKKLGFLKKYSYYVEEQLWFISSDVKPEFVPLTTMGLRIGIF